MGMSVDLRHGDCREVMAAMEPESVDAIVTDPPAGISFMGRDWDRDKGGRDQWIAWLTDVLAECLRVAKPGAHAVVWALPRTSGWTHRALEDAGWEVRDCITHLFGSGFPKSHNLPGGLGTALKPGAEFWYLARKPLIGTVAANVQRHGTGAINVDGCRIGTAKDVPASASAQRPAGREQWRMNAATEGTTGTNPNIGRWPANVMLDEEAAALLDDSVGTLTSGANPTRRGSAKFGTLYGDFEGQRECTPARGMDSGGPSRFYYCAKSSRAERNAGLAGMLERGRRSYEGGPIVSADHPGTSPGGHTRAAANHHPTVKPAALMRWLVRLVTPPGGIVLDPFLGSGTTGIACVHEGMAFVGIEQDAEYLEIARRRIAHWTREAEQANDYGPLFAQAAD